MWHCPHCGAPQAETARCWVCRRSSTTCSTCRHFRASLAADVNYCALDGRRRPLTGLELRGCWSERPSSIQAAERLASGKPDRRSGDASGAATTPAGVRGFVPVEEVRPNRREPAIDPMPSEPATGDGLPFSLVEPVDGWDTRTSLFGEPER